MSVALRGNLKDFGIGEIFQLVGQQRKTGLLEFSFEREQIQISFDRGSVVSAIPARVGADAALGDMLVRCGYLTRPEVDQLQRDCKASAQSLSGFAVQSGRLTSDTVAEVENLLTREAIFQVLRWSRGSFHFTAEEVVHDRGFDDLLGAEQILMDGMRMVDEWQTFAELVPSTDLVFERKKSFDVYQQDAGGQDQAAIEAAKRVFQLVDGRLPVQRIVDLSRLGTFDATRILAELRRREIIADIGRSRRARGPRVSVAAGGATLWRWTFALLPLALLFAVALRANREPRPEHGNPVFAVQRSPFESMRQRYASHRVRYGIESYRFSEGEWPRDLAQLEETGLLGSPGLASAAARPYYSVGAESGVVLLAPER